MKVKRKILLSLLCGLFILGISTGCGNSKVNDNKVYTNGEVVYFNVTTGNRCSESDYTETQSNTEVKEGCMKFYAFNDNGGDTVNLILDHNTTELVAWNSRESNASGPKEVLNQLKSDTSAWVETVTPTNYTMDQSSQSSKANYTIDYSSYKARLITAQEIAIITGNTSWDEKVDENSSRYFFDSKTTTASDTCKYGNTSGCQYGWLYDRTHRGCTIYGCLNSSSDSYKTFGYWTVSYGVAYSTYANAWSVYCNGSVIGHDVSSSSVNGVRPVITVLKSKLS